MLSKNSGDCNHVKKSANHEYTSFYSLFPDKINSFYIIIYYNFNYLECHTYLHQNLFQKVTLIK